jgi:membrane-associated phospholipid phosphatase
MFLFATHCCLALTALLFAWPSPARGADQAVPAAPAENIAPSHDAAAPGAAMEPAVAASTGVPDAFPTLGEYLGDIPSDIAGGTKAIFTRENVPLAIAGVGATLIAFTLDQSVQDYFEDHHPLGSGKTGSQIGYVFALGGAAGLFLAGELLKDRKLADTGVVSGEAIVVDVVIIEALKYATQRKRPNGSDNLSFPSGHASVTATFAASVSEMYDWNLAVAVPLYAVTAFVSASRIQSGEHYLSDAVAGIALGTIIGKSFAGYMKKKRTGQRKGLQLVGVAPLFGEDCRGFVAMLEF